MTIWLVRHGESAHNAAGLRYRREESPLTALGIKQAATVQIPARAPILLTSPLKRAYGTACIIAATHGYQAPLILDWLIERDYGQTCEEAAAPAREQLARLGLHEDAVVVTHAGIIKGLLGIDVTPPNGAVHQWQP